jgi:hypothetical protein
VFLIEPGTDAEGYIVKKYYADSLGYTSSTEIQVRTQPIKPYLINPVSVLFVHFK